MGITLAIVGTVAPGQDAGRQVTLAYIRKARLEAFALLTSLAACESQLTGQTAPRVQRWADRAQELA